jgi:hypothetical protein
MNQSGVSLGVSAGSLILDFQVSRTDRNKFLRFIIYLAPDILLEKLEQGKTVAHVS